MYLLDTVVLSELRRRRRNPGVEGWIASMSTDDLFLSAITIGEIESGIARQRKVQPGFARDLDDWLARVLSIYGKRILPVDAGTARRWGRLCAQIGNDGADLMIAATAMEHGLIVVTRNARHFTPTGVEVLNPFS